METPKGLLLLIILWSLAGLITYVLEVVETWHGTAAVPIKLLINVTLDVICASIWPITWGIWGIQSWRGYHSPINLVFG
jgi:hypothetical protein